MIVVGLDPGTSNIGLAIFEWDPSTRRWRVLRLPVIKSLDELTAYLSQLYTEGIRPAGCFAEDVAFSLHRKRQGFGSGKILQSIGALQMFAGQCGCPFELIHPRKWRNLAVGHADASKKQVRAFLSRVVVDWPKGAVSLNRSDAGGVCVAGGWILRSKSGVMSGVQQQ